MDKQTIIINGDNFSDLDGFFDEIDKLLTKNLTFKTGHNLDAFNDLLCGGFGVYKSGEQINLVWAKLSKSKKDLGQKLEMLLEIIKDHDDHITLRTED